MATKTIQMPLWQAYKKPIELVQHEATGRTLIFLLSDASGAPIDLTSASVAINGNATSFADPIYSACTVIDATAGKVSYAVESDFCLYAETVTCFIEILKTDFVLRTQNFDVIVRASTDNSGAVEASNSFTALTVALATVAEFAADIAQLQADVDEIGDDLLTAQEDVLLLESERIGWIAFDGTSAFSSVDNPTGVIAVSGDHTSIIGIGTKIKLTNAGHVIYGKVSKAPTYNAGTGKTTVTFWHEIDPATSLARYLIATGDVTNFYYSNAACPFGFPVGDDSWSVYLSSTSDEAGTADGSYHAVTGLTLNVPIGKVKMSYCGTVGGYKVGATVFEVFAALSSSTSAATNAKLRSWAQTGGASGTLSLCFDVYAEDIVTITEKTPFYFLLKVASGSFGKVYGSTGKTTVIKAVFLD